MSRFLYFLIVFALAPAGFAFERPLQQLAPGLPVTGLLSIPEPPVIKGDRIHTKIIISAPNLTVQLDALGRSKGNLGSSRNRLYWVGPTAFTQVSGRAVSIQSRARYESWAFVKVFSKTIKNKNFQDTKSIEMTLRPRWVAATKTLDLTYALTNIRNFPDSLERTLRQLGVEFEGQTSLAISDDDVFQNLDPHILNWHAQKLSETGLALHLNVSLSRAGLLSEVGQALGLKKLLSKDIVADIVGGGIGMLGLRY